jgi:hypothetical protein
MPARLPRPAFHRWSDVEGTPMALWCRIEQIAVNQPPGGMPSRLHQQGKVIGWDGTWLHVCFDHDHALILLRAHLVRVLDPTPGR